MLNQVSSRLQKCVMAPSLKSTVTKFFGQCTIHGVKYVYQPSCNYSRLEQLISRIIWIMSCVLSASVVIVMFDLIRIRYKTTPTITTVETNNFPIWNVEFPAVTLCNINKVYEPATQNIRKKLSEKGVSDAFIQNFLSRLASLISPNTLDASFVRTYRYLEELNYTTQSLMLELMQPCENMIVRCMWLGQDYPCRSMFRVTMTPEGLCCSFNNKAIKSDLEINNKKRVVSQQLNAPIVRVAGYGEHVGLTVLLDTESEWYVSPRSSIYGISVLIHDADDYPEKAVDMENVQPGEAVSVAVIPSVVVSRPEVRQLLPEVRNCLFHDEKQLRTSDKYTYASCLIECVVDTILKLCNCIPFYYPHLQLPPYSENSRQCTLHDVNCLAQHSSVFNSIQPPMTINSYNDSIIEGMQCDCLPGCSELILEVQKVSASRNEQYVLQIGEHIIPQTVRNSTTDFKQLSSLNVYFKNISCIKYSRELFMTWDAVIANLGGLFGLCLGGSIISVIEMLYFLTLPFVHRVVVRLTGRDKVEPISVHTRTKDRDMTQYGYLP